LPVGGSVRDAVAGSQAGGEWPPAPYIERPTAAEIVNRLAIA